MRAGEGDDGGEVEVLARVMAWGAGAGWHMGLMWAGAKQRGLCGARVRTELVQSW